MTTQTTLADFIAKHKLTCKVTPRDDNPNMDDFEGDHWTVRIRVTGQSGEQAVPFSKGYGHHGAEPTLSEVLDCMASDASGIENARGDFEDWAGEYGYDTDSRKAEKIFKVCTEQAWKLKFLLGDDAYNELLWNTERE